MDNATLHVSPREVKLSQVQAAVKKIGYIDGIQDVDVEEIEAEYQPEDWGEFSILVDIFASNATELADSYARRLATELGTTVLTEDELDKYLQPSGPGYS